MSRAAAAGILVKGGGALEALATVRTLVVDKTGTLTYGKARLVASRFTADWTPHEILRLAASLDQASKHVIAETLVSEARRRRLRLAIPVDAVETPGEGIEGVVEGRALCVGGLAFVARRARDKAGLCSRQRNAADAAEVAVAIDGDLAGVLVFSDAVREGAAALLNTLRTLGILRIVLASGDRRDAAEAVARGLALDAVFAELTPEQKTAIVAQEREHAPVMMVGDGVNDAPALSAADVGVAMGAKGAAASAEAADVVILVDRLDRLLPAVQIARGARRIALQSVYAGLGLSAVGMMVAAAGFLTPVQGALIQEAIDVAVILNALRALRVPAAAPEPRLECMSEPGPLLPEVPAAPGA